MKFLDDLIDGFGGHVAPFTGAWIEINLMPLTSVRASVAPFTGAWIEISMHIGIYGHKHVAPFTGAWIEIISILCV